MVNIIKIQLTDIARIWWQVQGDRLEQPISWEDFTRSFYKRFFLKIVWREMKQQFLNLKKGGRTGDEYAAEFLCLSCFAPYMVVDEEDRVHRFQ